MPNTVDPTVPNFPPQGIQAELDLLYLYNPDVANQLLEQLKAGLLELDQLKEQVEEALSKLESAVNYKGEVADPDALPTEGMNKDDLYYIQSTSESVIWNGTEWIVLGTTKAGQITFDSTAMKVLTGNNLQDLAEEVDSALDAAKDALTKDQADDLYINSDASTYTLTKLSDAFAYSKAFLAKVYNEDNMPTKDAYTLFSYGWTYTDSENQPTLIAINLADGKCYYYHGTEENCIPTAWQEFAFGAHEGNVLSVNGQTGVVTLNGQNLEATLDSLGTKTITEFLTQLYADGAVLATNIANINKLIPSDASEDNKLATEEDLLKIDLLPAQEGHSGEFLSTTNGSLEWKAIDLSAYSTTTQIEATYAKKTDLASYVAIAQGVGNAGKFLTVDAEGNVEATAFSPLPEQTNHNGVLQTNGTVASWNDYIRVSSNSILLTNTIQPAINGQIVIGKDAGGVGNSGVDNVIVGNRATAANYGIAIGADAKAQAESSIQIGAGTNTESGTFCVSTGTYPNQKNVTLLDNKGNVPSARITDSFNQALSDTNLGATMADIKTVSDQVTVIEKEIPAAASETNQLADKAFVNSSINNMAAFYITSDTDGDAFATKAALDAGPWYFDGTERTPTLNDYAIVLKDESHDNKTTRYSYTGSQWSFQYVVNNTELTQAQINAMNSGITTTKVTSYDNHIANKENPHEVTKAQVGLSNVDNTSDADKPISTATQAALNNKIGTDQVNQTISTTNKVATLLDIEGLRGDYCSRYGVTASPNGRVRIGTGNQMIVPAGLQLTIPGANGEPVAPLVTLASQVTVPATLTSDCVFAYVGGLEQPFQFCDKVCFSKIEPADDESTCQLWCDGKGWHFRSINEGNVWVNVRAHVLAECIFTGGNLTRLNTNGWYHDMYSKLGDIETLLATV